MYYLYEAICIWNIYKQKKNIMIRYYKMEILMFVENK